MCPSPWIEQISADLLPLNSQPLGLYFLSAHWTERALWSSCLIFTAFLWQYNIHCCFPFIEVYLSYFPFFSLTVVYTGFIIISFSSPQKLLFCSININCPPKISAGCLCKSKYMKSERMKESTEILLENLENISLLLPPSFCFCLWIFKNLFYFF